MTTCSNASSGHDLTDAMTKLAKDGYCVVPDVLSPSEVDVLRRRVTEQAEAEKALGWASEDGGPEQLKQVMMNMELLLQEPVSESTGGVNQYVRFLVNKGKILRDLVTHPVALEFAAHVLGSNFLLKSFSANIVKKGGVLEDIHRDSWWMPEAYQKGGSYIKVGDRKRIAVDPEPPPKDILLPPCECNVIWMLTDFTEENGATRLVPGTHLLSERPDSSVPHKVKTIPALGKAGSCLILDGRIWHATGKNLTESARVGLLAFYCAPYIRQNENYFLGLDPAILQEGSDTLLNLLGYSTWFFFGRGDALSSAKRLRAREPWIPELKIRGKPSKESEDP